MSNENPQYWGIEEDEYLTCNTIQECEGDPGKCEIPPKLIKRMLSGKKRIAINLYKKIKIIEEEVKEIQGLQDAINNKDNS